MARNIDTIDGGMEIGPEEVSGKMGIKRVEQISNEAISIATDILLKHPEIKQVTLDTMTDEERALIDQATKKGDTA